MSLEAKNMVKQEVKRKEDRNVEEIQIDNSVTEEPTLKEIKSSVELNRTADQKSKDLIKAEKAAKKAAKHTKKKERLAENNKTVAKPLKIDCQNVNDDLTVRDVVETLKDIVNVAKEVKDVTNKIKAIELAGAIKPEESDSIKTELARGTTGKVQSNSEETSKSKASLKAERRAKQEAQRAAKQAAQKPAAKSTPQPTVEGNSPKQKPTEKIKTKSSTVQRENWFQHFHETHNSDSLKKIVINSNLHPAIVKLGVQLSTKVITGSNARCIALLDALKKTVRDYSLPAKTEFSRGLDSYVGAQLAFLWSMRPPCAAQTNAANHFRHQLTQLPHNVHEFDAKKTLQEEIDTYIREQIDKAGEAISIAVRNKISNGDQILTYGCSSLIERILVEAWAAGVRFRTVVAGNRVHGGGREMLRRLVAARLPCTYVDITGASSLMHTINKVILGASSVLANGSVVAGVGTAQLAVLARACNVPLLVACGTHRVAPRALLDAFHCELGDPDDLIDKRNENSPLKNWRSNPNLTPLNLIYDVTPPSLVTAIVTELAILPCTSAPVVLRFKLSEYGV